VASPERVTACLIVQDEQERLPEALRSVAFCDEIVVVDGGSRDATVALARAAGTRVIENPWPGYARQRNVALAAARTEWVLELDADERVTPRLAASIRALLANPSPDVDVGAMARRNRFLGATLGASARYPEYRFRLFRRAGRLHDERLPVHEGLPAEGRTVVLEGDLLHELADSLGEAVRDVWGYARLQARYIGRPPTAGAYVVGILARPAAKFAYRLTLAGGWRDGWRGIFKIGLDCASDAAVWLFVLLRGLGAGEPPEATVATPGEHFGSTWGSRERPQKLLAVAAGEPHASRAAAWLAAAGAAGADTALITDVARTELNGVRLRHVPRVGPLEVLRAVEAEQQLLPATALVAEGRRARMALWLLPSRLRGDAGTLEPSRSSPAEAIGRSAAAASPVSAARMRRASSGERWPQIVLIDPYNAGLSLARRMTRLGAPVTVLEGEPIVGRSRGVNSVIAPFEAGGGPWLAALQRIAAGSQQAVVLTGTDRGSAWLADNADRLPANVRAFEHRDSAHLELMNKGEADQIARRAGVAVPWAARLRDPERFAQVAVEAPWPCVVKPVLSHEWRSRYGEVRAFLANDAVEAEQVLSRPLADGTEMLLNQYIPGGDEDVEEAIVVRLADGTYPVRFGCRKLRQYPTGFGETALGESSPLPETTAIAQRVLDEAGFVGVAGVETKRHADTGERWFLEVNVRLPAQWGLGDACGVQSSPRLVKTLSGCDPGPQPPLRPGVRLVQPDLDRHVVSSSIRRAPTHRRPAVIWRLLRSYSGARELGVFDPRDPAPGLALAGLFLGRRLARLRTRLRGRGDPLRTPSGTADGAGRGRTA
jgi:predicted ATP-grasp superfamily ATP-dependent carboligase